MNKDAFYFPHFSNARTDRKILRLRKELQIEGYGIYFMILEVLRDTPNFKYPMQDIDLLAVEFNTSEQKIRTVICNYGLFEIDENQHFFSEKFNEYLEPYLKMKEQRMMAGKASAAKRLLNNSSTTVQRPFNDRSTTVQQSKVKKSKEEKVNKSKEKEGVAPTGSTHTPDQIELFNQFSDWLGKHFPRVTKMKKPITIDEYLKLRETINRETLTKLLTAMENRADLHKKYVSAYLTIINWSKNEFNQPEQRPEQGSVLTALKNFKPKEDAA